MLAATAFESLIEVEHERLLTSGTFNSTKLKMSQCRVTCPELNDATDTSNWPTVAPNPDVSGIGVWLSIFTPIFAIRICELTSKEG